MNFSRVQNLRRLLPAAPALTRDARSPAVSVQPSIGAQSRSQLGRAERRASRGCGRRDLGTTPGAGTPGARAARGQGGGSWCLRGRAERRCRQGGRLPMDVCGGRRIEEQKEEEVGGATVAPSTRRRLGARAGCSAVNDERDTHSRSPALLPRPGFSAHPGSSGHGAWRARSPSQIPRGHVAPERAAHDSRATETRHLRAPLPCPRVHSAFPAWGRARLLNETPARADIAIPLAPVLFYFSSPVPVRAGPEWGWPTAAAAFPLVDATAATNVPF